MRQKNYFLIGMLPLCLAFVSCDAFPSRQDVRDSLTNCVMREITTEAQTVMCSALLREVQNVSGSVTILMTSSELFEKNLTDRGITLKSFLSDPVSIKYARAHIFKLPTLATGQLITLDGTSHAVVCNASSGICRVDDLIQGGTDGIELRYTGGKIYAMNGLLPF